MTGDAARLQLLDYSHPKRTTSLKLTMSRTSSPVYLAATIGSIYKRIITKFKQSGYTSHPLYTCQLVSSGQRHHIGGIPRSSWELQVSFPDSKTLFQKRVVYK